MAQIHYKWLSNLSAHSLPQHDGGITLIVKNLAVMFFALVQTLQPNSVNPIYAWYSQAAQYNNALKRDTQNTPRPLAQALYC